MEIPLKKKQSEPCVCVRQYRAREKKSADGFVTILAYHHFSQLVRRKLDGNFVIGREDLLSKMYVFILSYMVSLVAAIIEKSKCLIATHAAYLCDGNKCTNNSGSSDGQYT